MNDKRLSYPTGALRRSWQSIVCRAVLFFLVCLLPGTLWAATYYVDASNASVGDGSIDDPWRDISSITGIGTGDTILFKRGQTWHESLIIPADDVTIEAYGDLADPLPIFEGTYFDPLQPVQWHLVSGSIYKTTSPPSWASDPGMLVYKGAPKPPIATLEFESTVSSTGITVQSGAILIQKLQRPDNTWYPYCNFWVTSVDTATRQVSGITFFRDPGDHWIEGLTDSIELRQLVNGKEVKSRLTLTSGLHVPADPSESLKKDGDWYWNPSDSKLYLYSGTTPNDTDVQVSALETGIYAQNKQNLIIQDIAVQGFQGNGVHLDHTVGTTVQGLQITNIGAKTGTHKAGIMLDQCDASTNNNTITGNTIDSVLRVGIGIYAESANPSRGNTVSGNTIKNSGSSGISLNTGYSTTASTVTNNTITGNTILYANRLAYDSAGVYAIFVGTGNSITNNTILYGGSKYLRSAGIMIDQGVAPVVITGNRLENNSLGGIVVTGTGHTITGKNKLKYNGLASWPSAQIVFFPVVENVSGTTVRNNVVEAETGKYLFMRTIDPSLPEQSNNDIDYNTYRSRAAATFCWSNDWSCGWVNFSTWKSTTGHDTNSSFSFITDPPPPDTKSISSTYLLLLK